MKNTPRAFMMLGGLMLALCGCAMSPYKAKIPDISGACASQLQDLTSMPLTFDPGTKKAEKAERDYVEFGDIARCLLVNGARKSVALYRLNPYPVPLSAELNVKAALSTGGTFAPDVQILDSNFSILRHYSLNQFVRRDTTYSLNVFLGSVAEAAAYVLIRPDASKMGSSDQAIQAVTAAGTVSVPMAAGYAYVSYHTGTENVTVRPFLDGGKLSVKVERAVSAMPVQKASQN